MLRLNNDRTSLAAPNGVGTTTQRFGSGMPFQQDSELSPNRPGLIKRGLSKLIDKIAVFVVSRLFRFQYGSLPQENRDEHAELEISRSEALAGTEKRFTHKKGRSTKQLIVSIPAGVSQGRDKNQAQGYGQDAVEQVG